MVLTVKALEITKKMMIKEKMKLACNGGNEIDDYVYYDTNVIMMI